MDHNSSFSHIMHLLLKGFSIGTVSAIIHPISYPISASALLCQANVIRTSNVYDILTYAFAKAKNIKLFQGGGQATILKTFMSLGSVAVEDIWLTLFPPQLQITTALMLSKFAGLLFNIAVNGPLDVIRTRLALEEFGNKPIIQRTLASEYRKIVREEGFPALYSGWQVVILQFILDYWFQVWDGQASLQQQTGSVAQLFPMLAKFITDYALTVVKIRANIQNTGFFSILRSVVSQKGLRGFMAGWKIHFLLFPMILVNMVLANVMFVQLKKLLFPRPPKGRSYLNNNNNNINNNNNHNINNNNIHRRAASPTTITPIIEPIDSPNELNNTNNNNTNTIPNNINNTNINNTTRTTNNNNVINAPSISSIVAEEKTKSVEEREKRNEGANTDSSSNNNNDNTNNTESDNVEK